MTETGTKKNLKTHQAIDARIRLILLILFFFSGMSALIYQITWFRLFSSVFGVTVYAVSTVLTVFMAGLAAGSVLFGRVADRNTHPLVLFAILQVATGVYAIFVPGIVAFTTRVLIELPHSMTDDFIVLTIIRFVSCFLVLIFPTLMMGGSLPVLSKFFVRKMDVLGNDIGSLYSINNFGAVVGAFLSGFILIENIGLELSIFLAGSINVGIGFASLLLQRCSATPLDPGRRNAGLPAIEPGRRYPNTETAAYPGNLVRLVLWIFAIEGFLSLAYEVLWMRILSAVFMVNSVYSYTTIVVTFILGLSLGGYIAAKIVDRWKDLVNLFGYVETAIGISVFAILILFDRLPSMFPYFPSIFSKTWLEIAAREFFLAFLILIIPAILMGLTFPIASKIYTDNLGTLGKKIGIVGFLDIIGSVFGAFLTGFLFISILGLKKSMLILILTNILLGTSVIYLNPFSTRRRKYLLTPPLILLILGIFTFFPYQDIFARINIPGSEVIYYKEDIAATVVVRQFSDGRKHQKVLEIDGINVAGTPMTVLTTQKMQAHLPLLLHPDPVTVLTVGYGTGGSSWSIGQHNVKQIECVEIVSALRQSDRFFPETNHHFYSDPRLNVLIQDGRNYIMMTPKKYDAILNDSVHPIYQGNANLYTKEYFKFCKQKLSENGVMASWMPIWSLAERDLKMILKTFQTVFPHATLWYVPNNINKHMVLIGTPSKLQIDFKNIQQKLSENSIRADLAEIYMDNPYRILSCFLLDEDALKEFSADAPINTENHPYLEFSAPRNWHLDRETWHDNMTELLKYRRSVLPFVDLTTISESERNFVEKAIEMYMDKTGYLLKGILAAIEVNADKESLFFALAFQQDREDTNVRQLFIDSLYRLAVSYNDLNEYEKSAEVSKRAIEIAPDFAPARCSLGFTLLQTNHIQAGIDELRTAIKLEDNYGRPYYYLAVALYSQGADTSNVISLLEKAVALDPNLIPACYNLALLYQEKEMYSKAKSYVKKVLRLNPEMIAAKDLLKQIENDEN